MFERLNPCLHMLPFLTTVIGLWSPISAGESLVFLGDRHTSFPDVYQNETIEHEFKIKNATAQPIAIIEGIALSGTGTVHAYPSAIPPGDDAAISVTQPIGDHLGTTAFRFAIITDEPGNPKHRFSLSGFVQSAYEPEAARLDLGFITRAEGSSSTFELGSREVERLRTISVTTDHSAVAIETAPTGVAAESLTVRVVASPGLPRGILYGTASLTTNVSSQPRFSFSYSANVFDDVVPAENPVDFGLVRVGQEAIKTIVLQSRSGAPFEIDRATNTIGEILGISWKPCNDARETLSTCFHVSFSLSPEEVRITGGIANLYAVGDPEPVPIRVNSWVVSPDTVVKKVGSADPTSIAGNAP